MSKQLIILTGPTGIGKTDLSLDLAQMLGTEIISCDSRQMYHQLKIGTAPPSPEQLQRVKHHFIGNLNVTDYYSAGRFELEVLDLLNTLFEKYTKVLMTGGSTMYVDALVNGIDDLPSADLAIRQQVKSEMEEKGVAAMVDRLRIIDPEYCETADLSNPRRVAKAMEIFLMTGRKYSSFRTATAKQRDFEIHLIGLNMNRDELYNRIDHRVDLMLEAGLENEARQMYPYRELNALNTVGYKEFFDYFDGQYDRDEAVRLIKRNSRRYAKRQLSWFGRYPQMVWFDKSETDKLKNYVAQL